MALTTQQQQDILKYAVGLFGASAGGYFGELAGFVAAGNTPETMARALAGSNAFKNQGFAFSDGSTNDQFATAYLNLLLGSSVSASVMALAKTWFLNQITAVGRPQAVVNAINAINATATTDPDLGAAKQQLDNRTAVASYYTIDLSGTSTDLAALQSTVANVTSSTDVSTTAAKQAVIDNSGAAATGQTYALTTGVDTILGTNFNDVVNATDSTFTALDSIDGKGGLDTLNIIDVAGGLNTTGVSTTITNIETANFRSSAALTADTTAWTGLTALNVTQSAAATLTAAATTAVSVTNATGIVTVDGGSTVTTSNSGAAVAIGGTTAPTGAITVTQASAGTNTVAVDGGTAVTITATGMTTNEGVGQITVGGTTAPTGAVSVTYSGSLGADSQSLGDVAVTGGSTVNITQSVAATSAYATAVLTGNVSESIEQGDIAVTGGATTTAVTVNQTAARAAVASTTAGVVGIVAGGVTIADKNAASGTLAGTIAAVTLNNFGAATIDSSALTTVTLSGKGTSLGIGRGALTATPTANTLALNVDSLTTTGAVTDSEAGADDGFTTLNITTSGSASTIASLVAADATTLTVSGSAALTLTDYTMAGLTSVTVGDGGLTMGTATLATGATFTSGAGADSVIIGATTKAISTGGGDDTVTVAVSALGSGGTIDAGTGTNTLTMSDANAVTASANDTFEGKISNFQRLSLTGTTAANQDVKLNNLDDINYVSIAGVNGGNTLTLSGAATGATLNANSGAAGTVAVTLAVDGTADVLNVGISSSTAKTVNALTAGSFETINFTTDQTGTASGIAHIVSTLTGTDTKTVSVVGDAGLTLGTFTGTKVTSFDASGVTKGAVSWTTGALANAATITGGAGNDVLNASLATKAVTLSGNGGNDTLNGGLLADTINGGDGNDFIYGNAGADNLTGGAGQDIFAVITATDSNGANVDNVLDFVAGTDKIGLAIAGGGGNEVVTYVGEAGAYGAVLTSFTGVKNQAVLDTSTKTLYVDVDGDAALTVADIAINMNVSDLSQSDFATLGTTGADTFAMSTGVDTLYGLGGGDTYTAAINTATLASVATDGLSMSTVGMDIIAQAIATDSIDLTAALGTDANYDVVNAVAAGGTITKTVATTDINQFVGLYDYATNTFTSTATTAASSASTTDVAALMYLFATADGTTANQGVVVIGVAAQAAGAITDGVLTLA